jgi:hypothetical protein
VDQYVSDTFISHIREDFFDRASEVLARPDAWNSKNLIFSGNSNFKSRSEN